ncbi:MAG: F0F1 ATP synthase subunit alpha [Eubacterium sp.]
MNLRPEEISSVIKDEIKKYSTEFDVSDVGTVIQVADGIARIHGLEKAMQGELLEFPNEIYGMVLNLEEDNVGAVLLGDSSNINEGDTVKTTGNVATVPVGDAMLGRVVNALGQPIDGKGPIHTDKTRPVERVASGVISRKSVDTPLQTGIKAIDSMVPIGRGQRELIIGDRQTGKTAIAIDTILNQKDQDVLCIYVAIGQKASTVANIVKTLEDNGALDYTTVVASTASELAPLQYIAPYAGCAIGEEWMEQGKDVLIVYDDLSKHAAAYRTLSLLLRRPPGREAYPGDVFYLHSRLLERAARLSDKLGGGSLTALPIIETQAGDVSAYIPTNVISITDGQIYLETEMFNSGFRPAVNPGLSVSRVGGSAQIKAMKKIAGSIRIDLAQYRELAAFSQFGSDLDADTKEKLDQGERIREVLKQGQYVPQPVWYQVIIIYAATKKYLLDIPVEDILAFEKGLFEFVDTKYPEIPASIRDTKVLSDEMEQKLIQAIEEYKKQFLQEA